MTVKAFNSDSPLNERRIVIRRSGEDVEMVDLPWGLQPREPGARRTLSCAQRAEPFPATVVLFQHPSFDIGVTAIIIASVWFYLFRRDTAPSDV
jgi:hypothetical protein